jgi:hypothetical protein
LEICDMRKRRIGVTAGVAAGRLVPAMETTQTVSEIAAPLVSGTPKCTTSADGSVAILPVAREGNRAEDHQEKENPEQYRLARRGRRAKARMRRCLKLRQGASPLRPPAPFPWLWIVRKGENLSRVRYAGPKQAALDRFSPFPKTHPNRRERGLWLWAVSVPLVGRHRTMYGVRGRPAPYGRMRRCLILRQGASPLRPPRIRDSTS